MKSNIKFSIITALLLILSESIPTHGAAQQVSFQIFYDELNPYGQWVDDPNYGYIWIPAAGPEFMPYSTSGHWIWTEYGWTWVSDFDWGWAPFHYGRWDYIDYYGWIWVPGEEWGPAWVIWRNSPGYYGWAPIAPGISIELAIGGNYNIPADHWCFVNGQYMGTPDIYQHYGPRKNNQTYIDNSTIVKNTYVDNSRHTTYITGPKKEDVQKVTGREVRPVPVKENARPGQSFKNNELTIYRPAVSKSGGSQDLPRPAKITDKKDVKPVSERKSQNILKPQPENKKDILQTPVNKAEKTEPNKPLPKIQPAKPNIDHQNRDHQAQKSSQSPVKQGEQKNPNQENKNPVYKQQAPKEQSPQQHTERPASHPHENVPAPKQQPMPVPPPRQQPMPREQPMPRQQPMPQQPRRPH